MNVGDYVCFEPSGNHDDIHAARSIVDSAFPWLGDTEPCAVFD